MMQTVRFIFLGIIVLVLGQGTLHAQDPTFTQYFSAPMYLNPALAGFEGGTSIHLNHRDQWFWVGENATKFYTEAFGADVELGCINSAIGITYMHNMEGDGRYRWQNAGLTYAFRFGSAGQVASNNRKSWEAGLGLRVTYNTRGLNWDRFIFSDQLDRVHGFTGQATGLELPTDLMTQSRFFDVNFGTYFFRNIDRNQSLLLGFSFDHLGQVNPGIEVIPFRGTFHVAGQFNSFNPTLKLEVQRASSAQGITEYLTSGFLYSSLTIGSGFDFGEKNSVWGGAWVQSAWANIDSRNTTSLVFMVGGELGDYFRFDRSRIANRFRLGLSYDLPISGAGTATFGTWEVSLAMNFGRLAPFNCKCLIPPFSRPKFR